MKTAYLSIDLDYFDTRRSLEEFKELLAFIPHSFSLGTNVALTPEHQDLYKHMCIYQSDVMLNVDFHADLCFRKNGSLHDYNWANFIPWRDEASFVWINPHNTANKDKGVCDFSGDAFSPHAPNGWQKTSKKSVTTFQGLVTELADVEITAVGICISPDYLQTAYVGSLDTKICPTTNLRYAYEILQQLIEENGERLYIRNDATKALKTLAIRCGQHGCIRTMEPTWNDSYL